MQTYFYCSLTQKIKTYLERKVFNLIFKRIHFELSFYFLHLLQKSKLTFEIDLLKCPEVSFLRLEQRLLQI